MPQLTPTDRLILQALTTEEKPAGELLDLSGFQAYPALNEVLSNLIKAGLISVHYGQYRTFCLTELGRETIDPQQTERRFDWLPKN